MKIIVDTTFVCFYFDAGADLKYLIGGGPFY